MEEGMKKNTYVPVHKRRTRTIKSPPKPKLDMVNHPPHYKQGKIEVIDFIEDQNLDFHDGQVIKYICRAPYKGNELEDLEKAAWYLARKIKKLKGEL